MGIFEIPKEIQNEFSFFAKFNKSNAYKIKKRIAYCLLHPKFFKNLLFLLFPVKFFPDKYKEIALNSKYEVDFPIIKSNMKEFFKNNGFYFLNYNFSSLLEENDYRKKEVIFWILGALKEMVIDDCYFLREELIKNDKPVIFDCGANLGTFTLTAKLFYPDAKIFAFEPTKKIFQIFERILKDNKISDVYIFQKDFGESKKITKILKAEGYIGASNTLIDSNFDKYNTLVDYTNEEIVEVTTIDHIVFNELNLEKLDLIKIDVKGYEKQLLKGATKAIKKFKPTIICAAYHLPKDEEKIPELVLSINLEYKYKLTNRGEKKLIFY